MAITESRVKACQEPRQSGRVFQAALPNALRSLSAKAALLSQWVFRRRLRQSYNCLIRAGAEQAQSRRKPGPITGYRYLTACVIKIKNPRHVQVPYGDEYLASVGTAHMNGILKVEGFCHTPSHHIWTLSGSQLSGSSSAWPERKA